MKKSDKPNLSRKSFLKKAGFGAASLLGLPYLTAKAGGNVYNLERSDLDLQKFSSNDQINFATIGTGWMGQVNTRLANEVPGTKLVGVCDLYESRLNRCKELWGSDLETTMDYRDILSRDDVDAVIIATSDHWHDQITIDALESGKSVYLEKPIVQKIEQGRSIIDAEAAARQPLIVGSQRTSSILYEKARDLIKDGEIGDLNFVEAYWDRRSASGAWQYSIPPSASPENIDWDAFRKDLPSIPFDATHFFRWRNYSDYGTGVAGDLFVHLFSGLHMILDTHGPERILATGGLRYWKDGRDAEDLVLGLFDYPETDSHPAFNMSLRVNFVDGSGGGSNIKLVGSDGVIEIGWNTVTLNKWQAPQRPGMTINDFDESVREEYEEYYNERYPETRAKIVEPDEFVYRAPDGYNDQYDHFVNWFSAIRDGKPVLQDAAFGLRAAGPALLSNRSISEKRAIEWDPVAMNIKS